ncbi:2,3,4,5-tetrahydropyridine-2,6-carboxylate N-succinyltransferase [Natrinema pellirubrum DSM 15624]|uniref:2,3,4,5-tetrahydropyridine-2,6-carboxylate N-succinyltransferase n=1 Tax=Natrinema pellirubrum (strain DSM 15624 / CIP 106293 / JCM 10476 / NCIMB 786 / 157) TaxID=797303 RepID=L0JRK2_NATP1|nr:2,3,4,5-tetrahydropyridine-2,6-dicarboxylate N-succinyltransferase [Natrinema pellirubrum]AGB33011.1 tetrahydrodipicolinate N-succinyltransferase [Natrinema pellirubrum DSM 15624]ELY75115.1 2,3,4,5-tetrahydropyridine-2,6-carboxylate N-succinyltransferase [Natrinema pellirubrum DSM 15624]
MSALEREIGELWDRKQDGDVSADTAGEDEYATLEAFLDALESGEVRAAEKSGDEWEANEWVKQGILLNFGLREIQQYDHGDTTYNDVLPLADSSAYGDRGSRNTPDGTVVRRGAHVGSDCIMMSPSFVNIGAYVGDGTLVDSCDTVGSCAQIGDNVKLGANTLIGGVLEPVENAPVIVEDNVSLGAGCRVTSGFVVGENSVVGENTLLTPRIPVYDLVEEEVLYGELPADRRAFTRFVESSISDHDLFEGGAYKPAVVATDLETETLEATEREDALRE